MLGQPGSQGARHPTGTGNRMVTKRTVTDLERWPSMTAGYSPPMADTQVLLASNRGPVSFSLADDGALSMRRGGGGLVSALAGLHGDILWICATLSDADRAAARRTADGRLDVPAIGAVRMLDIPAGTFHRAYNAVANSTLWFVHHMLYDPPNKPHFDARSRRDWQSYEAYNAAFADALAQDAAEGAKIAVQDYHLALVPIMLRERRPDLKIVHFSHTPWAPPEYYRLLPDDIGRQVLEGILGSDHAGFQTDRWAGAFLDCCAAVLRAKVDANARTVSYRGHVTHVGVHGLGVDGPAPRERGGQPDVTARADALRERVGDRRLIVRIDRTELSKNIV